MATLVSFDNDSVRAVVVIPSDIVARKFVNSGALDVLMNKGKVVFVVSRDVKIVLPGESVVVDLLFMGSAFDMRLDLLFWYHSFYVYTKKNKIDYRKTVKARSMKWVMRLFHEVLSMPIVSSVVDKLDEWYFSEDVNVKKLLLQTKPDIVVAAGSALDSYSHLVLKTASKLGIPTLMVISHWDYFSKKGLLRFKPDKVYVWGEDMKNSAIKFNEVSEADVVVVGAPQFQKYLAGMPEKNVAKDDLGLDVDKNWLLFPGSGIPYDEISVLKRLSELLIKLNRDDIGIIYRPHPRAWARKTKEEINLEDLENVVIDKPWQGEGQSEAHYQKLISASEGIVSPYSTMILEGALCGLPALCVCFSDNLNIWDFAQAEAQEHIWPLLERDWVFSCSRSEDLEVVFLKFLEKIFDPQFRIAVRSQVRSTVYFDENTFAERLYEHIERDFL